MSDNDQATRAVDALFEATRRELSARRADGAYAFARVLVRSGTTEWVFERDRQDTWRLTYVREYGNGSFVAGRGCDAAGYVIRDADVIDRLNGTLARLGR